MKYTLPKPELLRGRETFKYIITSGNKLIEKNIVCFYIIETCTPEEQPLKVGFSVGVKVGKAVLRNRIKRLMRECYRLNKHSLIETAISNNLQIRTVFMFITNKISVPKKISYNEIAQTMVKLMHQIKNFLTVK